MIDFNSPKELAAIKHHPAVEELTDLLCERTQNKDRGFFQVEVAYFLGKMASTMRAILVDTDGKDIMPVNLYAIALATSGYGKGHSIGIMEREFIKGFRARFLGDTFMVHAEDNLWKLACEKAALSGNDEQVEKNALDTEFKSKGALRFSLAGATVAALQQMREKLLLGKTGAISLQIDEVGSNLLGSMEALTLFLTLYDYGMADFSGTKNTNENVRSDEVEGVTPANLLMFGTPAKIYDGGQTEGAFTSFLDTGGARRSLFAWGERVRTAKPTPAEVVARKRKARQSNAASHWATHFTKLADPNKVGWRIEVPEEVEIALVTYQHRCEDLAEEMLETDTIRKAEMENRHSKALKLAGVYAFSDESSMLTMDHVLQAIKLVEESGTAFNKMVLRDPPHVRLARFIANAGVELTHADMHEKLPYYKSSTAARNEMLTLARSWGHKNHIIIRKRFVDDGIEVFSGETLQQTDLNKMMLSYSNDFAFHYQGESEVPFEQLHLLTQSPDMHWCNHHFVNEHRAEANVIPGFNMVVLDIDGTAKLSVVHELLKDYQFLTYTTKRHQTDGTDRFRLIMPINYTLKLEKDDYREFMANVREWICFPTDEASEQASKKWMTHDGGTYHYNEGVMLDALQFIPRTSHNEAFQREMKPLQSLDNLERWFAQRICKNVNRNNQMIKFALALVDNGMSFIEVEQAVKAFDAKLPDPLGEDELNNTILLTVAKKIHGTP